MLTQRLAQFVVDTRTQDIPAAVLAGSRHALIDTLGCALLAASRIGDAVLELLWPFLLALVALATWRAPPWLVVAACACCGWGLQAAGLA